MSSIHTYYDVLMVSRGASQEVIRAAFKSLCQKYHLDRNTHPNAERTIQQINEAYSILSNPLERSKYDKQLLDYEQKVNQTFREKSCSQGQNESTTSNHERKNNTVIINIPDSISFSNVKAYIRDLLSKLTPLLIKAFSIIFCVVIAMILFNFLLTYFEDSNSYNTAQDIIDAQEEVQDAQEELNDADLATYDAMEELNEVEPYLNDSTNNPFLSDSSESFYNNNTEVQQASTPNHMTYAPNGQPFPSSAGYVDGYPQLNNDGASTLTIDNSQNSEAIFGKLYFLDSIEPQAVRYFYIPGGGGLILRDISAGNYDIRYKDLENNSISKSESVSIEEYEEYDGLRFSAISMTLYAVSDGNMKTYSIPESEF